MDGQTDTKIDRTHLGLCTKVPIKYEMDGCNSFLILMRDSNDIEYTYIWTHICILHMDG